MRKLLHRRPGAGPEVFNRQHGGAPGLVRADSVEGADLLAHIAPEHPVIQLGLPIRFNLTSVLDGEIAYAIAGIHLPAPMTMHDGPSGARVNAGAARAAAPLGGGIGGQLARAEQQTDDKPTPRVGVDQHRVLAVPPQARPVGVLPLQHRGAVHADAPLPLLGVQPAVERA